MLTVLALVYAAGAVLAGAVARQDREPWPVVLVVAIAWPWSAGPDGIRCWPEWGKR